MSAAAPFRAVVLDWRGTLVTTLTAREWVRLALAIDGREDDDAAAVAGVLDRLRSVRDRLDDPLADVDAQMHRAHLTSAFADAGIDDALYAVEPDPALFALTLSALGTTPGQTLMVGDRSASDGGAVEAGLTTLLLPPLRDVGEQRLHRVLDLCPALP